MEGWLAAPMLYPVSSATAKQLGLPTAPTKDENMTILKHKVVVCTLHKFLVLSNGMNVRTARFSKLQELLYYRMMEVPHTEAWTGYSSTYAPKGHTVEDLQKKLQTLLDDYNDVLEITLKYIGGGAKDWMTPAHIEHALCEYRKMMANSGKKRS